MEILQLQAGDAHRVHDLNALFAEAFDDLPTYQAAPPDEAYLQRVLAQDRTIVLVAMVDQRIVGGLVAYELPKLERARSEIYLYDLAVAAGCRPQGIATRVIDRLRGIGSRRGGRVGVALGDHGDEPAIALYQKLGAREEVLHFDLPVP